MFEKDIINQINLDFSERESIEVLTLVTDFCNSGLNVGNNQFVRSVIYLAEGNIEKIKNNILIVAKLDPRDVVMSAEEKAGLPRHYFLIPFDEMNTIQKLPNEEFKELNDERLPF